MPKVTPAASSGRFKWRRNSSSQAASDGNDTLSGWDNADIIIGGPGNDSLDTRDSIETLL